MRLLNCKELAPILGLPNEESIWRLMRKEPIPHIKVGRFIRFEESQIRIWLSRKAQNSISIQAEKNADTPVAVTTA